jgi:hypothetical protein
MMKRLAMFASILLALNLSTPVYAGPVGNLCGQTLTEDTNIKAAIETLPSKDCEITLASGVKLTITSSEISGTDRLSIEAASSARGTKIEILSSKLTNIDVAAFDADYVVIRDSKVLRFFDKATFLLRKDMMAEGSDFDYKHGLLIHARNNVQILGSDFYNNDNITIFACEDAPACTAPVTASINVMNSNLDTGDNIAFRSSGNLVLRNSHVRGESHLIITVLDYAHVSGNVLHPFDVVEISAGGLLILMNNDFSQKNLPASPIPPQVTFSGDSCEVKDNTFSSYQLMINNCF